VLHWLNFGGNLDLFVPAASPYLKYKKLNNAVGKRYFFRQSTIPEPSNDIFLTKKAENGYRIFVMGGSTALGFPYGNLMMFSRILNHRLQDTFPEKRIEVVNVALTAVTSYTILDFMDEVLAEKPDAILIYTGHNEFYGALGSASLESAGRSRVLILTYLYLNKYRTFRLLRTLITGTQDLFHRISDNQNYNPFGTLMERLANKKQITINSSLFSHGKNQFEKNLQAIFMKAKKANVPILISELVSNIHGLKPFSSVESDSQISAIQAFRNAQKYEKKKQYDMAKTSYYLAKDLDELRFRAPEVFNEIIHSISKDLWIHVVPMKRYFETDSPNALVGDNLMVDHLHPNKTGYFLMAEAFYKTLCEHHFIKDTWDSVYILPAKYYRTNWPFTELDSTVASLLIKQLRGGWPFQPVFTENRTLLDYKPESMVDKLALNVIFDKTSIEEAHLILAQYYDEINNTRNATREYDVLSHLVFIEAYSYLVRAQALLRGEKYVQALAMLKESLTREEIPLAYRLSGEICLKLGKSHDAIRYFEKARIKTPYNSEVLYGLCLAYSQSEKNDKARLVLKQFKSHHPDDLRIKNLEEVINMNNSN